MLCKLQFTLVHTLVIISHIIEGVDGDFNGATCMVTFANGSGPGAVSLPPCNITIINDLIPEQPERFSISATIINSNGLTVQFPVGGDSASCTIIDDDGMLILTTIIINVFAYVCMGVYLDSAIWSPYTCWRAGGYVYCLVRVA